MRVQLLSATEAFHLSIAMDRHSMKHTVARSIPWTVGSVVNSRPKCWWSFDRETGRVVVSASEQPLAAILWYAHTISSSERRDFRWLTADSGNWYAELFLGRIGLF